MNKKSCVSLLLEREPRDKLLYYHLLLNLLSPAIESEALPW